MRLIKYDHPELVAAMIVHRLLEPALRVNGKVLSQRNLSFWYAVTESLDVIRIICSEDELAPGKWNRHISISVGSGPHGTAMTRPATEAEVKWVLNEMTSSPGCYEEGFDPEYDARHFWMMR